MNSIIADHACTATAGYACTVIADYTCTCTAVYACPLIAHIACTLQMTIAAMVTSMNPSITARQNTGQDSEQVCAPPTPQHT